MFVFAMTERVHAAFGGCTPALVEGWAQIGTMFGSVVSCEYGVCVAGRVSESVVRTPL